MKLPSDECHWTEDKIGSGDDLMPPGNKLLPEPMLIQINVTIWRHLATMCWEPRIRLAN